MFVLAGIASFSSFIYVMYLVMVVRFRTIEPYSGPFFQLTLPLGFADLLSLVHQYLLMKLPVWGYFHSFYTSNGGHPWLAKYMFVFGSYIVPVQFIGVFLLALNRFTAMSRPLMYQSYWSDWGKKAVAVQFLYPLLMAVPTFLSDMNPNYQYVVCVRVVNQCLNGSDFDSRIRGAVPSGGSSAEEYNLLDQSKNDTTPMVLNVNQVTVIDAADRTGGPSLTMLAVAIAHIGIAVVLVATIVLNLATVWVLASHRHKQLRKNKTAPAKGTAVEKETAVPLNASEIRLTIAGLVIFLVMVLFLSVSVAITVSGSQDQLQMHTVFLYAFIFDSFHYMNPYVILACSTTARNQLLGFMKLKSNAGSSINQTN